MKIAVLYYSRGGTTRRMAQAICRGACSVPGCQAMAFPLEEVDKAFLEESRAVIFGTPTYYAGEAWPVKKWVDESRPYQLAGKLGGAFATADCLQGGAGQAVEFLIRSMLVKGMLVYSGGGACGSPYTHLGAVALRENFEESKALFRIFGERVARKALELFPEGK